jgi:GNAT superfamily N-acetyltransferase
MSAASLDRVRLMLRSEGIRGTLRGVAKSARGRVAFSEDHLWFALDPAAERPRPRLASELTLMRPGSSDLRLLEQLRTVVSSEAGARIDAGNDLWLVLEGDRLLFSTWVFRGQTPSIAASGGQLRLPSDTVCLEDSEAAPAARGRGIAPAAWAAITDAVAVEGRRWIITKVTVENVSSRRAVEKAGFEAVALMHFRRRGPRSRTWIEPLDDSRASAFVECIGPGLRAGCGSATDGSAS